MPQLNPAPWFMIFAFSWFIFLTVIPPKIMSTTFPNEPSIQSTKLVKTESWYWPWH